MKISRRDALGLLTAGAGLAALNGSAAARQKATPAKPTDAPQPPRAFRGEHKPAPLTFDPAKLKGLSEKLIRSHHENNYGGAVKALNAVERRLAAMLNDKDLPAYVYGDLKREELLRTGSVVLHEQYFANLGGDGRAGGEVLDALKSWFGGYEQ